jgi:hypothetical protein
MGEPSSAKPAKLIAYSRATAPRDDLWATEAVNLGGALDALRRALPSGLPASCQVPVESVDVALGALARDFHHLDEFAGDVGAAFARADGGLLGLYSIIDLFDATRVVTVDSDALHVEPADRAASEAQGRADAAALAGLLQDHRFLDWSTIENDPDKLRDLADEYPQLASMFQRIAAHEGDEDYNAALYNTLGPGNIQKLGDLVNQLGIASDRGLLRDDAYDGVVVPLAQSLSSAEHSGHLVTGALDGLFDFGNPGNDPTWQADVYDQDEYYLMEMRRRSLALLLNAGDWSSAFTARAADAITYQWPVTDHLHSYEGFSSGRRIFEGHPEFVSTEWLALCALGRDQRAANLYLQTDRERDGWHEDVGLLVQIQNATLPFQASVAAERAGMSPDDFRRQYFDAANRVLQDGLFDYPLATGTTYSPATTGMIHDMVQAAGEGDVYDEIKQTLARISAPYTQDLAIDTQPDRRDLPATRVDLSPDDVSKFFKELSFDPVARQTLATNAAAFVYGQMRGAAPDIAGGDPHAVGTETRLATGLYVSLGEAMSSAMDDKIAAREALVSAWRTITDPIVDLVTGKIVSKIPIVSTATELPIAGDLINGVTNSLKDAVNAAIYDHAIRRPEVEKLSTWADAIGPGVRDSIVTALYDDPHTQAALAGTGWSGTLDEFRAMPHVQDIVNEYTDDIITGFDAQVSFDQLFR